MAAQLDARAVRRWLKGDLAPEANPTPPVRAHLEGLARHGIRGWLNTVESRLPRDLASLVRQQRQHVVSHLRDAGVHGAADLRAWWADRQNGGTAPLPDDLDQLLFAMRAQHNRINLGRALAVVEPLIAMLRAAFPALVIHPAGSLRRWEPTLGDITLLLVGDAAGSALDAIAREVQPDDLRARTPEALTFVRDRDEVTLRAVRSEQAGAMLIHYSGSHAHVEQLRQRARSRGLTLGPSGLLDATGRMLAAHTEHEVYAALELPFIPAERRHGLDEIALAERGELRDTVTVGDIRGDLHLHTLWSDGRDTTEGMIWAARALGYEYMAITDHSPSAAASRVLTLERLAEQAREIAALRQKYPGITILHGCEVDILEDGSLDLPDDVMARLDIVLASLHDARGQEGPRLTERYLAAIRHPLVNVITHPANRMPGRSEGYDLDWDRLFAAARGTGTALEIDGAPGHIDLDGLIAGRAAAAGVTLTIDSDGHFADRIGRQMRIGVGTAARGGVEARHVLNTRSVEDVRSFVAAKRARR